MVAAGVLALQGAARPHVGAFARLGLLARLVRKPADLDGLTHLVLPGGESTTFARLLDLSGVGQPMVERFNEGRLALFGTCAGAILLGSKAPESPPRFGLADVSVERNAYGRQLESTTRSVELTIGGEVSGTFIRAPRFEEIGPGTEILGRAGTEPVLLRDGQALLATYHPELGDDLAVHRFFLDAFGSQREVPEVALRPTTRADLEFVRSIEGDPSNTPFIGRWTNQAHREALHDPNLHHFVIESCGARAGLLIAFDLRSRGMGLHIKRLVVNEKERGVGSRALALYLELAFEAFESDHVWLNVYESNARARHVYSGLGFAERRVSKLERPTLMSAVGGFREDSLTYVRRRA